MLFEPLFSSARQEYYTNKIYVQKNFCFVVLKLLAYQKKKKHIFPQPHPFYINLLLLKNFSLSLFQ